MKHLINDFYSHQREIIYQMNKRHNSFIDKKVNITITDSADEARTCKFQHVLFKGYSIHNGKIYVNWKNIKTDGSEYKSESNQVLFESNSIILTFSNEN